MDAETTMPAFLDAAQFAGDTMARRAIEVAWTSPSALPRMTVGDVAGHLFLVVRRVALHLDEPADESLPRVESFPGFPRIDGPDDLDTDLHRQVRDDGHHVAAWGHTDVVAAFRTRMEDIARHQRTELPDFVTAGAAALPLGLYLASRVVEVLVHADDLLTSIGEREEPPPSAAAVAVAYLGDAARRVHGDRAAILAFTRRERVPAEVPFIF